MFPACRATQSNRSLWTHCAPACSPAAALQMPSGEKLKQAPSPRRMRGKQRMRIMGTRRLAARWHRRWRRCPARHSSHGASGVRLGHHLVTFLSF